MREMHLKPLDPKDIKLEDVKVVEHEDEFVVHEVEENLSKKPPRPKSNKRPANRQKEEEWREERSNSRESPRMKLEEEKKEKKPIQKRDFTFGNEKAKEDQNPLPWRKVKNLLKDQIQKSEEDRFPILNYKYEKDMWTAFPHTVKEYEFMYEKLESDFKLLEP